MVSFGKWTNWAGNHECGCASGLLPSYIKDSALYSPIGAKYLEYCRNFEDIVYNYNGRPHWGKANFLDYKRAFSLYGENLTKFINVKHKLDPQGIFSNAFVNRICESKEH